MTGQAPIGGGAPVVDVVAWAMSMGAGSGRELTDRVRLQMVTLTRVVQTVEGTRRVLDGPDDVVADAIRQVLWHLDVLIGRLSTVAAVVEQEIGS